MSSKIFPKLTHYNLKISLSPYQPLTARSVSLRSHTLWALPTCKSGQMFYLLSRRPSNFHSCRSLQSTSFRAGLSSHLLEIAFLVTRLSDPHPPPPNTLLCSHSFCSEFRAWFSLCIVTSLGTRNVHLLCLGVPLQLFVWCWPKILLKMLNELMEFDAPSHNMGLWKWCGGVSLVSTVPTLGEMAICPFSKVSRQFPNKIKF